MLDKKEIEKSICPRCNRPVGKNWTLNCKGEFVCGTNCNQLHPRYNGR